MLMMFFFRRFTLDPFLSLSTVAHWLPLSYTGADLYALCSDAMLKAVIRQAASVEAKVKAMNEQRSDSEHEVSTAYYFDHFSTIEDTAVVVREADFRAAHAELIPSVSSGELAHYERVRSAFEGSESGRDESASLEQSAVAMASASAPAKGAASSAVARKGRKSKGKGKAVALTSADEYSDSEE